MGAVKIDLQAGERRIAERYALDSPTGVRLLLSEYHALKGRQFQGDYDAVVLLTDLSTAISTAGLTDRQRQALTLVYVEDLTQAKAGERLGGIERDAVNHMITRAIESIADVYYYWCGHGEGYTTTITKEESEDGE